MNVLAAVSWWLVPIPGIVYGFILFVPMWIIQRKRRWRDRGLLSKAVSVPSGHIRREPKEVRDLLVGESAWVPHHAFVTSAKRKLVYVRWTATIEDPPKHPDTDYAPLHVVRLKKGFSLELRPGVKFWTSPLPWGDYAPVIAITQQVISSNK